MTLTIALSPEAQRRLSSRARSEGVDLETLATRVLEAEAKRVAAAGSPAKPNESTLNLLSQWDQEEQTTDAAEIARRQQELEDFMQGINRARQDCEGPGSRKIYP